MKFFKRKKKAKEDIFKTNNFNIKDIEYFNLREFAVSLIYSSNSVNTIYPACASCYGLSKDKNTEYDKRLSYIGRRIKSHHTSVTEHSNIILQVFIPLVQIDDVFSIIKENNKYIKPELTDINTTDEDILTMISNIRDVCRYLNITTNTISDKDNNPIMIMTIGGSIRGYRYIFEKMSDRNNKLFISIFNVLKLAVEPEFFIDFINDGVMENYFTIQVTSDLLDNLPSHLIDYTKNEKIDILNMDNLDTISKLTGLSKYDCFDFVSITTDFKDMSRVITQQLTRHRNGITQESQRYVNYRDSNVNSPSNFKSKYDKDKVYNTEIGDYTFDQLGDILSSIYGSLVDQGVEKEDARGYLPQNIRSGHTYMTFTLRTLLVFLDLRLDSHSQAEIREYANILADLTVSYAKSLDSDSMNNVSKYFSVPVYKVNIFTGLPYELDEIDEEV